MGRRLAGIALLALVAMNTAMVAETQAQAIGTMRLSHKDKVSPDQASHKDHNRHQPTTKAMRHKSQGHHADLDRRAQEGKEPPTSVSSKKPDAREAHGALAPMEEADHSNSEDHRSAMRQYRKAFPLLSATRPPRKRTPTSVAPTVGNSDRTGGWGTTNS